MLSYMCAHNWLPFPKHLRSVVMTNQPPWESFSLVTSGNCPPVSSSSHGSMNQRSVGDCFSSISIAFIVQIGHDLLHTPEWYQNKVIPVQHWSAHVHCMTRLHWRTFWLKAVL